MDDMSGSDTEVAGYENGEMPEYEEHHGEATSRLF